MDVISNAIKHLKKINNEYENDYDDESSLKMQNLKKKRVSLFNDKKQKQTLLKTYENELKNIENEIEKNNEKLLANVKTKGIQEKRRNLEKNLSTEENNLEEIYNEIKRINKDKLADFIINKTTNIFENKVKLGEFQSKGVVGIDGDAINEIVSRGKCICGNPISPDSDEYVNLMEQKKYQPPANFAVIMSQFNEKLLSAENNAEDFKKVFFKIYERIQRLMISIEELKEEIEKLNREIGGGDIIITNIEKLRKELLKDKKKTEDNILNLRVGISEINKELEEKEKDLDKLALNNDVNKKILLKKNYVKEILKRLNNYENMKEVELLERLNMKVRL